MAALVVNQGLQRSGRNASGVNGVGTSGTFGGTLSYTRYIMTMSVDDSSVALAATHTAADTGGAVTNFYDQILDSQPTIASQTVTHQMTVPTGQGNFTIRRVILHDNTAANVTASSSSLHSGVDGVTFQKTADFTIAFVETHLYSNVP